MASAIKNVHPGRSQWRLRRVFLSALCSVAVLLAVVSPVPPEQTFVGQDLTSHQRECSVCCRVVRATGRTKKGPESTVGELWRQDPKQFFYGWSNEQGRWIDLPGGLIKKWWQMPSYLTPNGYRQPPHWTLKDYELCCKELRLAMLESDLIEELKDRGMTIEEIRARASNYEFMEPKGTPKLTSRMTFLLQVKCLHDGRDEELIDMRDLFPDVYAQVERREQLRAETEALKQRAKELRKQQQQKADA